ncbi:MAG: ABC transporter substrate-binding protein [Actinomycetia bacterium]|nr:ABC transporter substrate-binding protein [Actinomycetes bacterium]
MRRLLALVVIGAAALTGCGTSAADRAAQSTAPSSSGVQVDSCGETLTITGRPKKALVLGGTAFGNLDALGVVDQLKLRAGEKSFGLGQEELQKKYNAIPTLAGSEIETGGVKVATEVILQNQVDMVIGYDSGVDREALKKAGVQLYAPAAFCKGYSVTRAGWELIDQEVSNLAAVFGVPERAQEVIAKRKAAVADLAKTATKSRGTGVALYITPGDTTFYTYGTSSMVQPIFDAAGLTNAYADSTTRVFDASMEDVLKRNPDWVVLLSLNSTEEQTLAAFQGFAGADKLKAVASNQVVMLPFALTDPPTMLSVEGATTLARKLDRQ